MKSENFNILCLDAVRNESNFCEICDQKLMHELGFMYCIHCLIESRKYDIEIWVKERKVG